MTVILCRNDNKKTIFHIVEIDVMILTIAMIICCEITSNIEFTMEEIYKILLNQYPKVMELDFLKLNNIRIAFSDKTSSSKVGIMNGSIITFTRRNSRNNNHYYTLCKSIHNSTTTATTLL